MRTHPQSSRVNKGNLEVTLWFPKSTSNLGNTRSTLHKLCVVTSYCRSPHHSASGKWTFLWQETYHLPFAPIFPAVICNQNNSPCFLSLQDVMLVDERMYGMYSERLWKKDKIFINPRICLGTLYWMGWTPGVWKRWWFDPLKLWSAEALSGSGSRL